MLQFWRNPRNIRLAAAALAVVATVFLLSLTSGERARVTWFEGILSDALSPFQTFTNWIAGGLRGIGENLAELGRLRDENERLRKQVDELAPLRSQLDEALAENRELRRLLAFSESQASEMVTARVIGRNSDNWFSSITLNRGRDHGLQKDMAVVTYDGMVGRITKVTDKTATVQLLVDSGSGIGALAQSSREPGVVLGQPDGTLKMRLFNRDAAVAEGDQIVTSGMGIPLPKGLLIGEVTEVGREERGLVRYALVNPSADFYRLEMVMVVVAAAPETTDSTDTTEPEPPAPAPGNVTEGSNGQ